MPGAGNAKPPSLFSTPPPGLSTHIPVRRNARAETALR